MLGETVCPPTAGSRGKFERQMDACTGRPITGQSRSTAFHGQLSTVLLLNNLHGIVITAAHSDYYILQSLGATEAIRLCNPCFHLKPDTRTSKASGFLALVKSAFNKSMKFRPTRSMTLPTSVRLIILTEVGSRRDPHEQTRSSGPIAFETCARVLLRARPSQTTPSSQTVLSSGLSGPTK